MIEEKDAEALLFNTLPYQYDNVIFTPSQMSSHTQEDTILSLLAEEKRAVAGDLEGDSERETALYSRKRMGKRMTGKNVIECYYYGKTGHTVCNISNTC
jgi:hypothetical protein